MDKTWHNFLIFLSIFLFILFVTLKSDTYKYFHEENENTSDSDEFYLVNKPHYNHMPVTYVIVDENDCLFPVRERVEWAMEIIQSRTKGLIRFSENNQNPDITFICLNVDKQKKILASKENCINLTMENMKNNKPYHKQLEEFGNNLANYGYWISRTYLISISDDSKIVNYKICYLNSTGQKYDAKYIFSFEYFTLGIGNPNIIDNIISNSTIIFTEKFTLNSVCQNFPAKEIHEILHVFGLAHSEETDILEKQLYYNFTQKRDIMFPYIECGYQTEINEDYVSCLKDIYSNQEGVKDCYGVKFLDKEI